MTVPQLAQDRDLIFFDLETTGLNVVTDRIVQIAAVKYPRGGGPPVELNQLLNPQMPIPAEVVAVHGIDDAAVVDAPTFPEYADELDAYLGEADLAGYNLGRFDIPVLMEEFDRAGVRFRTDNRRVIDVQEIFYKMEPRTLAGALRFYCNRELEGAHDALNDVRATVSVLEGQLTRYAEATYIDRDGQRHPSPIKPDVEQLHQFTQRPGQLDATNRLRLDDAGEVTFNFGKYRGQRLRDVFRKEKSYYHWLQDRDFSVQVKEISRQVWESM